MAYYNNKVVFGTEVLLDLTTDTFTSAGDLRSGIKAHSRTGEVLTGTAALVYNSTEESLTMPDWSVVIE